MPPSKMQTERHRMWLDWSTATRGGERTFFFNWHIVLYFLVLFIPLVSFFSLDKTFPVEDESSPGKPHKDLGLFLTECRKTNV